jgi:uncharacterized protein with NRDE domain
MCLIFFAIRHHPDYPLIIAANRDEFHARETQAASFWQESNGILAGKDLEACDAVNGCGTWLGIHRNGRLALITNFRDPKNIDPKAPSRGHLVSNFLKGEMAPEVYLNQLQARAHHFNGFNLVVGTVDDLFYFSNYREGVSRLLPGVYGLSNHLLDTPWPKVKNGKHEFEKIISRPFSDNDLFQFLRNENRASDQQLPDTGIGLERERALSAMFIKTPNYGTRCSTVIRIDKMNKVSFSERVYDLQTFDHQTQTFDFTLHTS